LPGQPCHDALSHKNYNSDEGFKVTRNNLHETIPKMFEIYQVSVDVYPVSTVNGWSSLVHIGLGGDKKFGDRNPAIFFQPNSHKLHITSNINGNPNSQFNTEALPSGKWTTIVIQQQQGQFL
jgi:hypothetical protein